MNTTYYIEALRQKLEQSIAPQKISVRSTEFLSGVIFGSTHENISATTLQRFFGVVHNSSQVSERSLDIICEFLGYGNWNSFCSNDEINSLKKSTKIVTDDMGLKLFEMALKNHDYKTIIDYIKLLIINKDVATLSKVEEMLEVLFERDNTAKDELLPKLKRLKDVKGLMSIDNIISTSVKK